MGGPFPDPLVMCAQVKAQGMVGGGALLDATLPPRRARSASEVGEASPPFGILTLTRLPSLHA